jgi:hypothetical protein
VDKLTKDQAEATIASVTDLIDDPAFKPYFFKRLYSMGVERFLEAADAARREGIEHRGRKFASILRYGNRRY